MSKYVLETKSLTKLYGDFKALNNINLNLERGKIYGFVGPNGAGKTTFIRIITGLSFASEGSFSLLGENTKLGLRKQREKIGCLVEGPSLHPNMNAYQNLELQRICRGIPDKNIVHNVLSLVNLDIVGNKKVRNFSLGMKQRLGIAIALISNPKFLILDEPVNGLDPSGIKEIRELLIKLNQEENVTILISSHLLSELYQLATNYIIINNGSVVKNLSLQQLDSKCKKYISIKVDNINLATTVLEDKLSTSNYKVLPNDIIHLYDYVHDEHKVSSVLSESGLIITKFNLQGDSLEEYFLRIVRGDKDA